MKDVIEACFGLILLLVAATGSITQVYHEVRKAALIQISHGLSPLTPFTAKLTGKPLKFKQ